MATNNQSFEAIRVVGGLLGSKVLQDARRYKLPGQTSQDYGIEPGLTFNDEIGRYWRIARARWKEYQGQVEREDISSHKLAQEEWLIPLLSRILGYQLESSARKIIGEREFPITHCALEGAIPFVLCGANFDLDKGDAVFGQEGRKRSPIGLVQEYLNAESTCLWAIVSNGTTLRLLRDNPAMTRPAYIEVDFARLFDEDNYADFATLWLLLHATRLTPKNGQIEQCYIEQWREKGQDEGERALDNLRYGVADALRQLGTGFVAHPENKGLREAISTGQLSVDQYFQQVLRLVYRFLFLLTAEDRDIALLPKEYEGQDYRTARDLYLQGYSISQLRERASANRHYDHHGDAWQQLLVTFKGYAEGQHLLAQPALGGLFAGDQCETLENAQLENRYLYSAIYNLCYFHHQGALARINYRDMDTEEFGSVYESLLELIPQLNTEAKWQFSFIGDAEDEKAASGHSRKLTGSYYTPDSLVQELIKSALEPVIEERLKANPQQPREAILSITVCDPACGSGHFLLAAARRLAVELARIDAGTDQPTEIHYRHALRDVVRHCIYGVDLNPMAVELCKTGLWLESIEPGKPLSFLASHVQTGNALIGVLNDDVLSDGIPVEAYKRLVLDDNNICKQLAQNNRDQKKAGGIQFGLFSAEEQKEVDVEYYLEELPEEEITHLEKKAQLWKTYKKHVACSKQQLIENIFVTAFLIPKTKDNYSIIPTNEFIARLKQELPIPESMLKLIDSVAKQYSVFNWHQSFPKIFSKLDPGFDVVLGNPPWDKVQAEEQDYFSSRIPEIAKLKGQKRKRAIEALKYDHPRSYKEFYNYKQSIASSDNFFKNSGRYPLTGKGKLNTYALFAELNISILNSNGITGMILPLGIATDDTTKQYFEYINTSNRLRSLYGFENEEFIFASVHHAFKFVLLTVSGSSIDKSEYAFFCRTVNQISDDRKRYELTPNDISQLNPNTRNAPIFRTKFDAQLTKKLYEVGSVIVNESDSSNPWNCTIRRMLNPTDDADLLVSAPTFEEKYVMVYEAKMIHQYDHRFGTYDGQTQAQANQGKLPEVSDQQHSDSDFTITPRHWMEREIAEKFLSRQSKRDWLISYRDITSSVVYRTVIACFTPRMPTVDPCRNIFLDESISCKQACAFVACLNSLVFDYIARQKVSGNHLAIYVFKQLPVIPPQSFSERNLEFISKRALELTYTSIDMKPFAKDLNYHDEPFTFDSNRRHQLKCELDAYFAKLYGLTHDELRYILDPAEIMEDGYPSETFRVLKNKEKKEFGEYRTQRLVLEAWDKLERGELE
tara:strand:- start:3764 stop:7651 length:3888 start_codon:yes stop_codon:yes gene_type:complete